MENDADLMRKVLAVRKKSSRKRNIVTLGRSAFTHESFRIDLTDLSVYLLGMPGGGKSNLLAYLFAQNQDLPHGRLLIDPMGKMTNELILSNLKKKSE